MTICPEFSICSILDFCLINHKIDHSFFILLKDSVKANSSIYTGANYNSSYAFPDSPKPTQTSHFSMEYKTEGFGDYKRQNNREVI